MYGIKTAAEATEMLQEHINKLGEAAGNAHAKPFSASATAIPDLANSVAFWRGYAETFTQYERVVERLAERGFDATQMAFAKQQFLTSKLINGGDDASSGRGNDARRRHFDGVREAVQELHYTVQAEFEASMTAVQQARWNG